MAKVFNADEVFAIGIQIEKNGKEFYSSAAKKTEDLRMKAFFSELAQWEEKHISLFESLKNSLPETIKQKDVFDPDNMIHLYLKAFADSKVFTKEQDMALEVEKAETPIDILNRALEFEKESVVFYSSIKEIVGDDLGKGEIDKLVHEELNHVGQITKEINALKGRS